MIIQVEVFIQFVFIFYYQISVSVLGNREVGVRGYIVTAYSVSVFILEYIFGNRDYRFFRIYGISAVNALEVNMDMAAYITAYCGVEYQTVACIRNLCARRSIPLDLIFIASI